MGALNTLLTPDHNRYEGAKMAAKNDITVGQRFGRLAVISLSDRISKNRKKHYVCKCDCGVAKTFREDHLKSGRSKSCGCLSRELAKKMMTTHGMKGTKIYRIWCGIIQRCKDPNLKLSKNYIDRGIGVCDRWLSFENFYADMGDPPGGMSIDRINNDLGYAPSNCRWATVMQQQRNKRSNIWIEYQGVKRLMVEWAEILGVRYSLLSARYYKGWPAERLLTQPKGRPNFHK